MYLNSIIAGEYVKKVVPLIAQAKCTIDICVFDWRWYPQDPASPCQLFNQEIIKAINRGVQVRAIVNQEAVAKILKAAGAQTKKFSSSRLLHTKLLIIDNNIVVTGSHNYTQSAFTSNYEFSVILSDIDNISEFSKFFSNLWSI